MEKNNSHDSLKLYFFDRDIPFAGKMNGFGVLCIIPTIIYLLYILSVNEQKGKYSMGEYDPLIVGVVTILFFVGMICFLAGGSGKKISQQGFFAARDGKVYLLTMNPNLLKSDDFTGVGRVGQLVKNIKTLKAAEYYDQLIEEEKGSRELFDHVNKWLDDGYSELFAINDLVTSNKFLASEKKAYLKEFERLSQAEGTPKEERE